MTQQSPDTLAAVQANPTVQSQLRESLEYQVAENAKSCEANAARAMVAAMASASPKLDSYVSWCLAGTGATAALVAGNLDKTQALLGAEIATMLIAALVISILCGSASKFVSINLQVTAEVMQQAGPKTQEIFSAFRKERRDLVAEANSYGVALTTNLDPVRFENTVADLFPKYSRWLVKLELAATVKDRMRQHRVIVHGLTRQSLWCAAQLFFITAGLFCIVLVDFNV